MKIVKLTDPRNIGVYQLWGNWFEKNILLDEIQNTCVNGFHERNLRRKYHWITFIRQSYDHILTKQNAQTYTWIIINKDCISFYHQVQSHKFDEVYRETGERVHQGEIRNIVFMYCWPMLIGLVIYNVNLCLLKCSLRSQNIGYFKLHCIPFKHTKVCHSCAYLYEKGLKTICLYMYVQCCLVVGYNYIWGHRYLMNHILALWKLIDAEMCFLRPNKLLWMLQYSEIYTCTWIYSNT